MIYTEHVALELLPMRSVGGTHQFLVQGTRHRKLPSQTTSRLILVLHLQWCSCSAQSC